MMGENKDVFHKQEKYRLEQTKNPFNVESYSFEDTNKCLLTTPLPGPFYLNKSTFKSDIRDNQEGIDLLIGLKIVNINNCKSIANATVDIWQCNAYGEYSGFTNKQIKSNSDVPTNNSYLRGRQDSDSLGFVEFTSIYPSWYDNRTNHILLKVFLNSKELLTTQLFFPQEINDYVQTLPPYNKRPKSPNKNKTDPVLLDHQGAKGCWFKVTPFGKKFMATLTISVEIK